LLYFAHMLTIYCGEDVVASREAYLLAIKNDTEVKEADEIVELAQNNFASGDLFNAATIFATENLIRKSKRSKNIKDILPSIVGVQQTQIICWEDYTSREFSLKGAEIKEFKIKESIFTLLDSIVPGNSKSCIMQLQKLCETQAIHIIVSLLYKHVRTLLLTRAGIVDTKLQAWQLGKIKKQASLWEQTRLMRFLEGLIAIEKKDKTSGSPLSLQQNIEILLCYVM
jgi:hypothetical protein